MWGRRDINMLLLPCVGWKRKGEKEACVYYEPSGSSPLDRSQSPSSPLKPVRQAPEVTRYSRAAQSAGMTSAREGRDNNSGVTEPPRHNMVDGDTRHCCKHTTLRYHWPLHTLKHSCSCTSGRKRTLAPLTTSGERKDGEVITSREDLDSSSNDGWS